jgi:hypothetical protein
MALLALAPACGFSANPGSSSDAGMGTGMSDAAPMCFGTLLSICFPAAAVPDRPRMFGNADFNTDLTVSGSACDQNNDHKDAYCVVAGAGFVLTPGARLTATGGKPLVLLSTTDMDLSGTIDVASHLTGVVAQLRGPGANPDSACSFTTPPIAALGGGGGAGASLGTQGGGGGHPGSGVGGGLAGSKLAMFPGALRGGCKGGDGSANVGSATAGGDGGGAIALIAATSIHVDAAINASGGGGHGGARGAANGGGGGGSGGMIVLDAPQLMFGANARLWANGGSGGQGASPSTDGGSGSESSDPATPASGGMGGNGSGLGADGAVGNDLGPRGGNANSGGGDGGGGGGGGGGIIHAPGLTGSAVISPPSSDPPAPPV